MDFAKKRAIIMARWYYGNRIQEACATGIYRESQACVVLYYRGAIPKIKIGYQRKHERLHYGRDLREAGANTSSKICLQEMWETSVSCKYRRKQGDLLCRVRKRSRERLTPLPVFYLPHDTIVHSRIDNGHCLHQVVNDQKYFRRALATDRL